jgi:hypothetical protein
MRERERIEVSKKFRAGFFLTFRRRVEGGNKKTKKKTVVIIGRSEKETSYATTKHIMYKNKCFYLPPRNNSLKIRGKERERWLSGQRKFISLDTSAESCKGGSRSGRSGGLSERLVEDRRATGASDRRSIFLAVFWLNFFVLNFVGGWRFLQPRVKRRVVLDGDSLGNTFR